MLAWVASPTELLLELMLEGLEVQVEQRVCQKCEQLEQALESRTDIGIAIGLLMERERVTRDVAFAMLRTTSQHTNRKLRDIAFALATGADLLATAGEACPDSSRDAVAPANGVVRRIVRLEPKDVDTRATPETDVHLRAVDDNARPSVRSTPTEPRQAARGDSVGQ